MSWAVSYLDKPQQKLGLYRAELIKGHDLTNKLILKSTCCPLSIHWTLKKNLRAMQFYLGHLNCKIIPSPKTINYNSSQML